MAGQHQIRDAVGATSTAWSDMIQFKGTSGGRAIAAAPTPFFEQVSAHFPPDQLATLIFHAGKFWILQELGIEAYSLHLNEHERSPSLISAGVSGGVFRPLLDAKVGVTIKRAPAVDSLSVPIFASYLA